MLHRWVLVGALVVAMVVTPVSVAARDGDNEAPLADAGLDQRVDLGTTVLLDATGSRDGDGRIETYEWRIETPSGGVIVPQCPTCGTSQFHPTRVGTYAVTVTVRDDDGASSTDTLFVTVEGASTVPADDTGESDPAPAAPPLASGSLNPPGTDPARSNPACTGPSCAGSSGPDPWVDITGPSTVATGEEAGFVLEYGGFRQDPQFGWSIGADGVTGVEEWNSPGSRTIYVTAASDAQTARATHDILVTENQKPMVDIQTPDQLHAGQTITLTAEASDPDGWIVNVEWVNGPRVTVPKGNTRKSIAVTATDNNAAKATDVVILRGEALLPDRSKSLSLQTLYCYYTQESERRRQNPDHCEMEGSDNSDDRDGYHSVTSNLARALESPHYNVVWKKTDEEIVQHSGDVGDDVGTRMPDVVDNDGTVPVVPTLTDDQRDAITGDAVTTSTQSFTLEGKTVTNDLDGDGSVNAADWDERFGSDDTSPAERHRDAVSEAKDARRATNRATGGGGPASSDDRSSDSTESSDTSGDSDGRNTGAPSNPLGGSLPDSLTDESAGEHAAQKGERIAENGLDLGVGY